MDGLQYKCSCGETIALPTVERATRSIVEQAPDLQADAHRHRAGHVARLYDTPSV